MWSKGYGSRRPRKEDPSDTDHRLSDRLDHKALHLHRDPAIAGCGEAPARRPGVVVSSLVQRSESLSGRPRDHDSPPPHAHLGSVPGGRLPLLDRPHLPDRDRAGWFSPGTRSHQPSRNHLPLLQPGDVPPRRDRRRSLRRTLGGLCPEEHTDAARHAELERRSGRGDPEKSRCRLHDRRSRRHAGDHGVLHRRGRRSRGRHRLHGRRPGPFRLAPVSRRPCRGQPGPQRQHAA